MKWSISRNGNAWCRKKQAVAIVSYNSECDAWQVMMRFDRPFSHERDAMELAEKVLETLADHGLTELKTWPN